MNKLSYYLEQKHQTLAAYNMELDFFMIFNKKEKAWVPGVGSFQSFEMDWMFTLDEIKEAQAAEITGGVLPYRELEDYQKFIGGLKTS